MSEPFYKWRNHKKLNKTQKKDKVQLRFAIASGLMVSMLAFCGVYTLVNGGEISTSIDLSAPIETPAQARRMLKHRMLSGYNVTIDDLSPTAAPTEISHRSGTCPGIPKPSANLYTCTRYEVARQNSCSKYFTEVSRTVSVEDGGTGYADGLGECKVYSGEKGPYPPNDATWYACEAALALCQANGEDVDSTAIFDPNSCYCPAEVPATCESDKDCEDGEGGKTMCFTADMCDDDEGGCEEAGQCFKPGLAQGDAGSFLVQLLILFYMFLAIAIVRGAQSTDHRPLTPTCHLPDHTLSIITTHPLSPTPYHPPPITHHLLPTPYHPPPTTYYQT